MSEDLRWVVGIFTTLFVALTTTFSTWVWRLSNKQSAGDRALHQRIDDVKDDYVRRDDLAAFRQEVSKKLDELQVDQKETNKQILQALRGPR